MTGKNLKHLSFNTVGNTVPIELKVGKRYPAMQTDHAIMQLGYSGIWNLFMGLPHITDEELQDYRHGRLQMALADVNGLLFVLYRFGNQPWCDVPFEPRFHPEPREFPQMEDASLGVPMLICLFDTSMGELKVCRLVGLPNELTERLHARCRELDTKRPLDIASYDWKLQQAYRRYRRSSDLLRVAKKVYDI